MALKIKCSSLPESLKEVFSYCNVMTDDSTNPTITAKGSYTYWPVTIPSNWPWDGTKWPYPYYYQPYYYSYSTWDPYSYPIGKLFVEESDNEYVINLDAPGLIKESIEGTIEKNNIEIKAKYKEFKNKLVFPVDNPGTDKKAFVRIFNESILSLYGIKDLSILDYEKVMMEYLDGVLQITLPKKEGKKPIKITVK